MRFIGLAKNNAVKNKHSANPIGKDAPAQKPNSAVKSVLPKVALESTDCAIKVAAAKGKTNPRPATR